MDVALDATGHEQAKRLAEWLAQRPIDKVLSSDLTRCRETLAPYLAVCDIPVEFRQDLRERTFGSMEGEDYKKLHHWMGQQAAEKGQSEWEVRPPGGESLIDLWNRLDPVYKELCADTRPTLVVSHGGAMAQLLAKILDGTQSTARAFRFLNASVTLLSRRVDGSFVLQEFNFMPGAGC